MNRHPILVFDFSAFRVQSSFSQFIFDGLLPSLLSPSFLERMKEVGGRGGGGGRDSLGYRLTNEKKL